MVALVEEAPGGYALTHPRAEWAGRRQRWKWANGLLVVGS